MVNQQMLQGNWNEISGKLKKKWGQLSDDDLRQAQGNADQLIGTIQRKTGESRESIERFLNDLTGESAGAVHEGAERAREYAEQASETLHRATERLQGSMRAGYEQAEGLVQQRPAESLAVVFGVGLVAGLMVGLALRR